MSRGRQPLPNARRHEMTCRDGDPSHDGGLVLYSRRFWRESPPTKSTGPVEITCRLSHGRRAGWPQRPRHARCHTVHDLETLPGVLQDAIHMPTIWVATVRVDSRSTLSTVVKANRAHQPCLWSAMGGVQLPSQSGVHRPQPMHLVESPGRPSQGLGKCRASCDLPQRLASSSSQLFGGHTALEERAGRAVLHTSVSGCATSRLGGRSRRDTTSTCRHPPIRQDRHGASHSNSRPRHRPAFATLAIAGGC